MKLLIVSRGSNYERGKHPGFQAFEAAAGIDAAGKFIDYLTAKNFSDSILNHGQTKVARDR